MERVRRRKPTDEEIEKALNPDLTDATATLCGQTFKVRVLPLNKEQVFLKLFKRIMPRALSGNALIDALLEAEVPTLCELAAIIAANADVDLQTKDILENGRLVDIVQAIQVQLDENGYLDFLVRMVAVIPEMLAAKQ